MEFVAIDFETANKSYSSVCQVGVVVFRNGEAIESWGTYINPEEAFMPQNIEVHGLVTKDVIDSPKFQDIYPILLKMLSGRVVVSHGYLDFYALLDSARKAGLEPIDCKWIDTIKVAKKAWPEILGDSYKLNNLAECLGLELKHHDAESDAKVAGEIMLKACQISGKLLEDWIVDVGLLKENPTRKIQQPKIAGERNNKSPFQGNFTRKGNESGPLFGKRVLFTGDLSMKREEATDRVAKVGCDVVRSINKRKPLIVVVGALDKELQKGKDKSEKLLKAEKYKEEGHDITIISESDFMKMLSNANSVN